MRRDAPLTFYNTLSGHKEQFSAEGTVLMYNCGPTVYDVSHVGNLRSYVFADVLRRVLGWNGYDVRQVINITDFGHLSSDADLGDDKMTKALRREGLDLSLENMRSLAEKYVTLFVKDLQALNVDTAHITFPRASDFIAQQISLIEALEKKGDTYRGKEGVYFDTSTFSEYGKLGDIDLAGQKAGARVENDEKKNPTDFLLWKSDDHLGWQSPWGLGFPGWHIECSAMIQATLGEQIDIHTGGIDLMPTHHNNEIAQSECASGKKPFSRFWLHHEFLQLNAEKISKSAGNMINLSDLTAKNIHPLAYRYFLLGAHYKTPLNFTWEALEAAQNALFKLYEIYGTLVPTEAGKNAAAYRKRFEERINDDLDTAGALAILWELTRDEKVANVEKIALAKEFDTVLGLSLLSKQEPLPEEIERLKEDREQARLVKNWQRADEVRSKIEAQGYEVKDTANGTVIYRRPQS